MGQIIDDTILVVVNIGILVLFFAFVFKVIKYIDFKKKERK